MKGHRGFGSRVKNFARGAYKGFRSFAQTAGPAMMALAPIPGVGEVAAPMGAALAVGGALLPDWKADAPQRPAQRRRIGY
jgi:hypothetical protein